MPIESLEQFLGNVRESCEEHAERKGYLEASGLNPLIEIEKLMGTAQGHAIGEIVAKMLEFQRAPRKVIAEKIAGWAWRLWISVEDDLDHSPAPAPAGTGARPDPGKLPCDGALDRFPTKRRVR